MVNNKLSLVFGLLGTLLAFFIGVQYGSNVKTTDMIELYDAGKREALKISPRPSLELELVCANIWAGKVNPPEVFK